MKIAKSFILGAAMVIPAAAAAQEATRDSEANKAFVAYPKESLEQGEQGTVGYMVKIDGKGRPRECEVTQSSGFQRLDLATCSMLMNGARFTPTRDGRGKGRGSVYEGRVVWRLS